MACESRFGISIEYLVVYRVALVLLTLVLTGGSRLDIAENLRRLSLARGLTLVVSLLRMGGCPPLIGFYAKVGVTIEIISVGH